MGCVYLVTNMVNGKMYVGYTTRTLDCRRYGHESDAKKGSCPAFHKALRKYGFDAFKWERLYRSDDNEKLLEREIFYIKLLGTKGAKGYNLTDGGDGGDTFSGRSHKPEAKLKIGNANRGKKPTVESIAKMRNTKRIRGYSQEGLDRLIAAGKARYPISGFTFKGHKHTLETRARIGSALKGKKLSLDQRNKLRVIGKAKGMPAGCSFEGRKHSPESIAKMCASHKLQRSRCQ